jgi:hypothetical protein
MGVEVDAWSIDSPVLHEYGLTLSTGAAKGNDDDAPTSVDCRRLSDRDATGGLRALDTRGSRRLVPMTASLPNDVALSLRKVLEVGERVLGAVTSLAGTLVLTDRHVFIVREGRDYRPQTGIRSWALAETVDLRYGAPRGGMGRLVVGNGREAVSFFVKECDWTKALRLVTMARGIAHRAVAAGHLA